MPSVFSEDLKSSEKSRSKVAPRPKLSVSAAVAAAFILEVGVAARSGKKNAFYREILRSRDPDMFSKKKPDGRSFMWGSKSNKIFGLHLRIRATLGEIMLNKVPWALGEVSLFLVSVISAADHAPGHGALTAPGEPSEGVTGE